MIRPARDPYKVMPVAFPMEMKIRNSGSRNKIPGNIWVESTTTARTRLPRNRYRLTASAAQVQTISELTKYRASGTVRRMAMFGLIVTCAGIQWNVPVTSCSGLSELLTITYTGSTAKMVSSVSTIRRVQMKERGGASGAWADLGTGPPSGSDQQVHLCDQ